MSIEPGLVVLIVVVFVAAALLKRAKKGGASAPQSRYTRSAYLLSKAELSFYGVLKQAVGEGGVIFSKVRVADVLSPVKGQERSAWQRAFNKISAKHFDFVICEPNGSSIRLALELDDSSHNSSKRVKRDEFLNQACESAELPLLRIRAAKSYSIEDIREQLATC